MKYIILLLVICGCGHVDSSYQGPTLIPGPAGAIGPTGASAPLPVTDLPVGTYLGCFVDTSTRALPNFLMTTGATVENCIAAAKAAGYSFAGVQYGIQCFAGNNVGFSSALISDCNTPCAANTSETCGGTWRNSIYFTGLVN
jgi:hypothetical protein